MSVKKISLVIPVHNEEKNLHFLLDEISNVLEKLSYQKEVIIIDDGSTDATWKVISEYSRNLDYLKGVCLVKTYGQTQALQLGFEKCQGDIIIVMDGDGQNDPADIPSLLTKIEEGYDVVNGWRFKRQDSLVRRFLSALGNFLACRISSLKLHDIGCSLKAYRKEILQDLKLIGEMHRILPIYLFDRGAKIAELKVNHRRRKAGRSKYGVERIMKFTMDLILYKFLAAFISRPIYIFGGFGFVSVFLALVLFLFIVYRKVVLGGIWLSPLFFISVTLFTLGILFVLLGIIAELLVRVYYQTRYAAPYKIKEEINF